MSERERGKKEEEERRWDRNQTLRENFQSRSFFCSTNFFVDSSGARRSVIRFVLTSGTRRCYRASSEFIIHKAELHLNAWSPVFPFESVLWRVNRRREGVRTVDRRRYFSKIARGLDTQLRRRKSASSAVQSKQRSANRFSAL